MRLFLEHEKRILNFICNKLVVKTYKNTLNISSDIQTNYKVIITKMVFCCSKSTWTY